MRKISLIYFMVVLSFIAKAQNIIRFEHFFDTDPGYGLGTITNVTPATSITDFDLPLSTTALSPGFHKLYIRAQNTSNQWTQTDIRSFYIVPLTVPGTNIIQLEYFFDTDPGFGLATQVSFSAAPIVNNLAIDISATSLSPGFHKLYVRGKTSEGNWTHTQLRSFYVTNVQVAQNLVKLEYFFDADPGFDNGIAVPISPAAPSITNQDIFADASSLSQGSHTVYVRAKNTSGEWTQISSGTFSVTAALPPTITSFSPSSGPIGTTITITGSNFNSTPANNIVIFGATRATVSAATTTQLTVTLPAGATYAPISVLDATTGLLAYANTNFAPTFTPNKGTITAADFDPKVDFTSGATPYSVAGGDLDGDGKSDLVTANFGGNSISVFRNASTGVGNISYAPKIDYSTGASPYAVAIGDLDGDGKADLAVANASGNSVSVFRNISTGVGNIDYATRVDFTAGTGAYFVAIGDLDNDGKVDLAVANFSSNTVSVFRNTSTGAGNISYAAKVDFTTGTNPRAIAIGDLDGDNKADLAVANNGSASISVFRNISTGSGNIAYAAKVDYTAGNSPTSIAIGDLDGDGKADIAVANVNNTSVSVFRNTSTGAGNIGYATKVDYTTGAAPISVAIGDLDGDSKADLAVTNAASATVSIFRNTSTGAGNVGYATKADFTTASGPFAVSIGDLDGDGKSDLAVANSNSNSVSIIRNNPIFPPTITGFTPSSGATGTVITITGTNFTGVTDVSFGGTTAASFTIVSPTTITAVVGAGTSGNISVTAPTGTATLAGFIFIPAPTITSFTPTSGSAGATVTITGTDFTGATDVSFGGTAATSFTVVSSTSVTAVVGNGTSGTISVTTPGGTATSSATFTLTLPNLITISSQPITTAVCDGSTASFTLAAGGTTNITYQWQKFNGITFDDIADAGAYSGTASATLSVSTTGNFGGGDYRCKVSGDNTLDAFSNTVTLTVTALPTAPTAISNSVCAGSSITIGASGGVNGQYRWYTTVTGGSAITNQTNNTFTPSPALTATSSFWVSINNGVCESMRTEVVATVVSLPNPPTINPVAAVCSGGNITLTASGSSNGNYRWYDGANLISGQVNSQLTVSNLTSSKAFQVSIFDGTCESSKVNITASTKTCSPPAVASTTTAAFIEGEVTIDLRPLISDAENDLDENTLQVISISSGAPFFLNGLLLTINYAGFPFSGEDIVTISACDLTALCTTQAITIALGGTITVYNAISPNGDDKNATLYIQYIDLLPETRNNNVMIYNRWGDVVFEATNYDNVNTVFRGLNSNGDALPTGTYYYKIKFENGSEKTGFIALRK